MDICGSIKEAVRQAKSLGGFTTKVEVECRSEADAMEALEAGADIVMLDNASPMNTSYWSASIKQRFPNAILEVSGGIDEMNMEAYMENGYIDIISMGGLTQDQIHVDFSLKINS